MRVLFIDLAYHTKTKSADFFLEILRSAFDVETHYYDVQYQTNIPQEKVDRADVVIMWEAVLGRRFFAIPGKPCIYVPMYDGEWGSRALWKRIARSGCRVVSFSDKISTLAKCGGVPDNDILELRYAYNPADFPDSAGDPDIVALWERGFFSFSDLKKLFPPKFFKKVILFRRPQPDLVYESISESDRREYNVEINDAPFLPKADYVRLLREPGVYVAPRPKEGIGMSFLEQLAMGKCVIVHDDGTMNEYVKDGVNGIVRNFYGVPKPVTREDILTIRKNVLEVARRQYDRWQKDRGAVVSFVTRQSRPVEIGGLMDIFWRGVYMVEAALARL